jgi:hypothetical protein
VGAEHAAAIEKVAAPAEKQQDALVQDGATPEEARVLMLQRQAGNRAVTSLLRGSAAIQREISWKASDLEVGRSWKDRVRTTFATDTYSQIIEAVKDFHAAREPKRKMYLARVIEWRTDDWLQRHGNRESAKEQKQKRMIENLNAEAKREVGNLRAQAMYMRDMKSDAGLMEGGPGGFKGLYGAAKKSGLYSEKAEGLAAGKTPGGQGADKAAAEVVAKYELTAAEITAIRTFTLPDYAYINPATANADQWLKDNVGGMDHLKGVADAPGPTAVDPSLKRSVAEFGYDALGPGLKLLKQEGALQAGMLAQAAAKLPKYTESAFRGKRMSMAAFKDRYIKNPGQLETFASFSSASKSEAVAQGYADGTSGDVKPKPNETVSILYEITMTNGRDISALSAALSQNEEEVLILPGAAFKVTQSIPLMPGSLGKPEATLWYRIMLIQIR